MRTAVPIYAAAAVVLVTSLAAQGPPPAGQGVGGRGRGAGAASEAPRTGTGLIVGRVVDGTSTRPITGAVVDLMGAGVSAQRVRVDADGRFLFRDLPSGELMLVASKPGYLGGASGQRIPNGPTRPVDLGEGEKTGAVTLRLWKYGVIAGSVVDDQGEPIVGIQVSLIARVLVDGRRRLAGTNAAATTTDDLGTYRFGTVPPGEYVVVAQSAPQEVARSLMSFATSDMSALMGLASKMAGTNPQDMLTLDPTLKIYPPAFYPSAPLPSQAIAVAIQAGDERTGVDIRARLSRALTVTGALIDQAQPLPRMQLQLLLADEPGFEMQASNATSTPEGSFTFIGVPAGRYVVRGIYLPRPSQPLTVTAGGARGRGAGAGPLPTEPVLAVNAPVVVGESGTGPLSLSLQRGVVLRGRVEFEGATPPPPGDQLPNIGLTILPAETSASAFAPALRGRVEPDGSFATMGASPGRYRLRVVPPAPWRAKSAITGGRDLLDTPIEIEGLDVPDIIITLSDRLSSAISGTVRSARGDADAEAVVVIFPADPRLRTDFSATSRRMRAARTTRAGVYAIPDLPAGEYFVVAGSDEMLESWLEAAALERLSRQGTRVTIAEAERKTLDLRGGAR
jgi:hypothetical protein